MRNLRHVLCLLLIILAARPCAAGDLDGLPIVRIKVVREPIFDTSDPATSSWPYRAANALHVTTREGFIRSMLLFAEGDLYSRALAEESARLLRSLGWLNPVEITARRVEGGVEVTVRTHDQWTLEVGAKAGLFGNRAESGFSFTEKNLLGWGRSVSLDYESSSERSSWTYSYFDPLLFGSRWQARVQHEDSSDGFRDLWRAELPFFQLSSHRSWGVEWRRQRLDEHLYSGAARRVTGEHRSASWSLWTGVRLPAGEGVIHRLVLGFEHREDAFSGWRWLGDGRPYGDPAGKRVDGVRIGFSRLTDAYQVVRGFRAWSVQEDLELGPRYDLEAVWSLPALGGDRSRVLLDGHCRRAWHLGGWVLLGDAWTSGRVEDGGAANVVSGFQVAAAELGSRGWQARLRMEASRRLDRERQLTLGADQGLRGWDPDAFDGTGRAVLNLQYRRLVADELLHVFSLGVVVFADAGTTWNPRVGSSTGGVRTDVGVGLLADLTHIGLAQLLRLEVALPDDGSGPVVTLTSSALF
jgi:hypothetical protein